MNNKFFGLVAAMPLATAGMIAFTGAAQAATFDLQSLITNNSSFIVGDKKFSNFTCTIAVTGFSTPQSCSSLNVITLDNDPFGIKFQGGFSANTFSAGTMANLDALLGFEVEVLDPNQIINSVSLAFNGAYSGNAFAEVVETAYDELGQIIGQLTVESPSGNGSPDLQDPGLELGDYNLVKAVKKLKIVKDIQLSAFGTQSLTNSNASISFVQQNFHQIQVPEPTTFLGLGIAGLALAGTRRRQAKKN